VVVGGLIEHAREEHALHYPPPPRVQCGSTGTVIYASNGQNFTPYPPKQQIWNDVPPPSAYQQGQQYYSTPVQPQPQAAPNPQDTVRDAFDSVKDITKLDFYVQRGAEAQTPGALRAKAGDLGSLFDANGQLNGTGQQLLDPKGTGLFAYDKLHNEIYTTKPADQIDPQSIADFQRKSWAIREAVEGNPDEAIRKLGVIQGADASPNPATVKEALNVASDQTHMDFKEKDGVLRAKMDGVFHHRSGNLNALFDRDPQFMQALLGNGNIIYDRDHGEVLVKNPEQTSLQTLTDFQRNAEALGLAADGKFAEAHAKWNQIHGADQLPSGNQQQISQGQAPASQTTQPSASPHSLDELNAALAGTGLSFRADDKGNWVTDAGKIKDMTDDARKQLLGDGLVYDPKKNVIAIADQNNIDIDDLKARAAAIVAQRGEMSQQHQPPGRTPQGQQADQGQPVGPSFQDYMHAHKQDIVAETQIMLETLRTKGIAGNNKLSKSINATNHQGIDGLQGKDTDTALKEFKQLMDNKSLPHSGPANSELDEATFRRLVQNFQKVEGLDESGSVDQKTLDRLRAEQTNISGRMKVQHEVKEGMEVAVNRPGGGAPDADLASNGSGRTANGGNGAITDIEVADAIKAIGGKVVLQSAQQPGAPNVAQITRSPEASGPALG
jgi:hypothetical protein